MARGGRRPGAGAPRGNVNGMKSGVYSPRFQRAALIIAVIPELRLLFHTFEHQWDRKQRRAYIDNLSAAYNAVLTDPTLRDSIKQLVATRIREALQTQDTRKHNQAIKQPLYRSVLDDPR